MTVQMLESGEVFIFVYYASFESCDFLIGIDLSESSWVCYKELKSIHLKGTFVYRVSKVLRKCCSKGCTAMIKESFAS